MVFQSTRPRGARRSQACKSIRHAVFQSTRPRGARQQGVLFPSFGDGFQSTRPRGARRQDDRPGYAHGRSFNPRARVGRDDWKPSLTLMTLRFQSTRPRGARLRRPREPVFCKAFQSTRPRGARLPDSGKWRDLWAVSIHAPAWGATIVSPSFMSGSIVSIHAPAWGATRRPLRHTGISTFQSTRPRGARHNERGYNLHQVVVSIHAPAWGATVHLLFPIILHKYASLFEDVSHVCPHFRFMSVME